jgi:3-phosphoglycerate kinase
LLLIEATGTVGHQLDSVCQTFFYLVILSIANSGEHIRRFLRAIFRVLIRVDKIIITGVPVSTFLKCIEQASLSDFFADNVMLANE